MVRYPQISSQLSVEHTISYIILYMGVFLFPWTDWRKVSQLIRLYDSVQESPADAKVSAPSKESYSTSIRYAISHWWLLVTVAVYYLPF